jgi:hypothetical protein
MEITAELVETSTEARCGFMTFEAAHRSVSSLDPARVLLDPIIQILVRPVFRKRCPGALLPLRMQRCLFCRKRCAQRTAYTSRIFRIDNLSPGIPILRCSAKDRDYPWLKTVSSTDPL